MFTMTLMNASCARPGILPGLLCHLKQCLWKSTSCLHQCWCDLKSTKEELSLHQCWCDRIARLVQAWRVHVGLACPYKRYPVCTGVPVTEPAASARCHQNGSYLKLCTCKPCLGRTVGKTDHCSLGSCICHACLDTNSATSKMSAAFTIWRPRHMRGPRPKGRLCSGQPDLGSPCS